MTMRYYQKRPVIIGAEQWFPGKEVPGVCTCYRGPGPHLHTPNGVAALSAGEWVIRGIKGEYYPCRDDIFKLTYEEVPVEDAELTASVSCQLLPEAAHVER